MKYDFDRVVDRFGTYSWKYDVPQQFLKLEPPFFSFAMADMDFVVPKPVSDAVKRIADTDLYGYATITACKEFYPAICRYMKVHHKVELDAQDIIYVGGVIDGLRAAIRAFSMEGDGIIIQRPAYGHFADATLGSFRKIVDNHLILTEDGSYLIDFEDLEKKCADPNNRLLVLCNPHNPSGRMWTREELEKVCRIARRHNVVVYSDEIHSDIVRRGCEQTCLFNATDDHSNLIVSAGGNKTFNCAGLHTAFVAIKSAELRSRFVKCFGKRSATPFTIAAMTAMFNEGDEWLEQVNDYIDGNFDFALDYLRGHMPWVRVRKPEATYMLWMDLTQSGLDAEEIKKRFLQAKIIGNNGDQYDPALDAHWQRWCICAPRSVIRGALEAMEAAFADVTAAWAADGK